jgi:ubiquitin C-terminal hydrolase
MNSVLQCLVGISPLTQTLSTFPHNPVGKSDIISAYLEVVQHLHVSGGRYTPKVFREVFLSETTAKLHFGEPGPHDAHGFLLFLIDQLDRKSGQRLIPLLFEGRTQSLLMCNRCRVTVTIEERLICLSVSLPKSTGTIYLEDCLDLLRKEERLVGDDGMLCPRCNALCNGKRWTKFLKFGRILLVCIQRFRRGANGVIKNEAAIDYPDMISGGDYTESSPEEWRLVGVVIHTGSGESGRYSAVARESNGTRWWLFEDEDVRLVDQRRAHSPNAYLLFYESS